MKKVNILLLIVLCITITHTDSFGQRKTKNKAKKETKKATEAAEEVEENVEEKATKKAAAADGKIKQEIEQKDEVYVIPTFDVKSKTEGDMDGFAVLIPQVDLKSVSKQWKKTMKKTKGDVEGDAAELNTTGAKLGSISADPVDVNSRLTVIGDGVELFASFATENDGTINAEDHPNQVKEIKSMLNNFALIFEKEKRVEEWQAEKKRLNELEGIMKKLARQKSNYEAAIEKAKKAIAENEHNIKENIKEQDVMQQQVEAQKKMVTKSKNKVDLFK